jgi:hypothetical protein
MTFANLNSYFPAFLTPDSMSSLSQIQNGNLDNWHPIYFTLFVKIFSLNGEYIFLYTILQTILIYILVIYSIQFLNKGTDSKLILLFVSLFTFSPYLLALPLTIWKDVIWALATISALLAADEIINGKKRISTYFIFIAFLTLSLLVKHNSSLVWITFIIITIIFSFITNIKLFKMKQLVVIFLMSSLSIFLLGSATKIFNIKQNPEIVKLFPLLHTAIYLSNEEPSLLGKDTVLELKQISPNYEHHSGFTCSAGGWAIGINGYDEKLANEFKDRLIPLNIDLLIKSPTEYLKMHVCRSAAFLPPPISNGPKYIYLYETKIYDNNLGYRLIDHKLSFTKIAFKVLTFWDRHLFNLYWPGLQLLIIICIIISKVIYRRIQKFDILISIYLIGYTLNLFLYTPGQDLRYGYITSLVFLIYSFEIFRIFTKYFRKIFLKLRIRN